ncbi:MAG: hypothetical protein WCT50_03175 [Patescibacteria group bacterium]
MYNKIAQIILNSGKASGASGVFVAQPDSLKESLAGKIFILGEVDGKKSDGEKIINFLISDLSDNYYNDEKIMLRGRIEGLKIENIFEAALAKMNKNLSDFLTDQKIKINSAATSLTVGVVYENKLHFASFGKNRALLIYRRSDGYEIINVETSAENSDDKSLDEKIPKLNGLFSSIISGEIPLGSYFIFTSESLPEYLSGREMVEIVTKLPPIVAAEQIKNTLAKINIYVPFLGIIIKNTTDSIGQEIKDPMEDVPSVQASISSLNSTEQRTEQMLAPAGIISFKKISSVIKTLFKGLIPKFQQPVRKMSKMEISSSPDLTTGQSSTRFENKKSVKNSLLGAGSFLRPEKIKLKQTSYRFLFNIGKFAKASPALVHKSFWAGIFSALGAWLKNLNKKNRLLFVGLIVIALVFSVSLVITNRNRDKQKVSAELTALVAQIEEKGILIDSHLLYNDEEGAAKVLIDAKALIASLPRGSKIQEEAYNKAVERLSVLETKINKIVKVDNAQKVKDLAGLNISKLTYAAGKLYGVSGASIYTLTLDVLSPIETKIEGASNLEGAKYDGKDNIYYRDGGKIIQFNIKTNKTALVNIKDYNEADGYSGYNIFNQKVYLIAKNKNQIYTYNSSMSTRSDWLKDTADLSQASDLYIDGSIYTLNSNGSINKFYRNKKADYKNIALNPAVSASKILGDSKQLYILDTTSKRLAIIAKADGHLMSQYVFDSLNDLKDFALDETGKAIYLLSSDGIYKFGL